MNLGADNELDHSRYSIGWVLECMLCGLISALRVLEFAKRSQWGP